MFRRSASVLTKVMIILLFGAAALLGTPTTAGAAPDDAPSTLLPPGVTAVLGDPVSGRTFVSSRESGVVTALDAGGEVVGTLSMPFPSAMAVHDERLYVVAGNAGTINVFTTDTLTLVKTLQPAIKELSTLAWAGGALWTSTACNTSSVCLAKVDPVKATRKVYAPIAGLTHAPRLLASPTDPNALFAWDDFTSPASLFHLDVGSRLPVVQATAQERGSMVTPAFTPDGMRVLYAAAGEMHELDFSTLQPTGRTFFGSGWFGVQPQSGRLAVVSEYLYAFEPDTYAPSWFSDLQNHNLAWIAVVWPLGETRVQVIATDWAAGETRLYMVSRVEPTIESTTTVLSGPGGATGEVRSGHGAVLRIRADVTSDASGSRPTSGTITFSEGSTTLGTAEIADGVAAITVDGLAPGPHQFTASYGGNQTFSPSTSSPLTVQVVDAATTTSLTTSHPTSLPTDDIDFEAIVTAPSGSLWPTGVVTFYDGDEAIATITLSFAGGTTARARFSTWEPTLEPGTHRFTAVYSGDRWFSPSQSAPVDHTVLVATPLVTTPPL